MMHTHSFAICAYGNSPYLEACIRSLKRQSIPTPIILCTSTPSSYIDRLADVYGIPVYVREGESDIQTDWNFAYQMADSKLVTIAHQDDMYHKNYAATVQNCWNRHPDTAVLMTDAVVIKQGALKKRDRVQLVKKILRLPLRLSAFNHLTEVKKAVLRFGNPIMCPSCTYHKEQLGEPLFHSVYKFALDWDTMLSLAERSGRWICVERPLLFYRIHEAATTKGCIENHCREREETQMYAQFWPQPVVKLLMRFYRKAYDSYD
ncbi:MAG: glycosyltransferase family A protein [Hungatella sp.]